MERELRQEAGFGCAKCGHPYLEYHHIVPYAEEARFRPQDMIALCGNCHREVSTYRRDRQYELKNNPFNIYAGIARGTLGYDKRDLRFRVGGNWYENVPTILRYSNIPVIACSLQDGQANISLILFDDEGRQILSVDKNNIEFRVDDLWDFEHVPGMVVARYGPRQVALRIDFRADDAVIEGSIWLGGRRFELSPEQTTLPGQNRLRNCSFSHCAVGIQIGQLS